MGGIRGPNVLMVDVVGCDEFEEGQEVLAQCQGQCAVSPVHHGSDWPHVGQCSLTRATTTAYRTPFR